MKNINHRKKYRLMKSQFTKGEFSNNQLSSIKITYTNI